MDELTDFEARSWCLALCRPQVRAGGLDVSGYKLSLCLSMPAKAAISIMTILHQLWDNYCIIYCFVSNTYRASEREIPAIIMSTLHLVRLHDSRCLHPPSLGSLQISPYQRSRCRLCPASGEVSKSPVMIVMSSCWLLVTCFDMFRVRFTDSMRLRHLRLSNASKSIPSSWIGTPFLAQWMPHAATFFRDTSATHFLKTTKDIRPLRTHLTVLEL